MEHVETDNLRPWEFLDYRAFLRAFYEAKKRRNQGYSYRIFSQKTGVNSPNYMKLIIDGQRNLTRPHAQRVARYCGLSAEETKYFLALVRWNQCSDPHEAEALWEAVLKLRATEPGQSLPTAELSISTRWHLVTLIELTRLKEFRADPEWVRARLRKPLSDAEIRDSFETLARSGILEKVDGTYRVTSHSFKTPDDVPSASLRQYHHRVIEEAAEALKVTEIGQREYVSTTVAVRGSDIPRLKEEIRAFRDRVLAMTADIDGPEEVFQLNIQLFPLTKKHGGNA